MNRRLFHVSLASPPEVRTNGSFADTSEHLTWVQPADLWQAMLVHHAGTFVLNGHAFAINPFDLVIVPPGSRCEVQRSGQEAYVYDYFTFVPVTGARDVVALPMLSPLGDEGRFWDLNFRRALNRLQLSRTSACAVAYAMLWAIAEPAQSVTRNLYVERAETLIASRIAENLRIPELARELGISQSQLCRLFVTEHGRTPKQYLREVRAQTAFKLLTETTMPIKQVAAACGSSDTHAFNRFVREWLGVSPRAVRAGRAPVDIYRVALFKSSLATPD